MTPEQERLELERRHVALLARWGLDEAGLEAAFAALAAALARTALPTSAPGIRRTAIPADEFMLMNATPDAFEFKHYRHRCYLLLARQGFVAAGPRYCFVAQPGELLVPDGSVFDGYPDEYGAPTLAHPLDSELEEAP